MLAEITILLSVTSLILFVDFNSPTNYSKVKFLFFDINKEYKFYFYGLFFSGLLILITILSGSYAVWTNAGYYCPSWPLCGRDSIIPSNNLEIIHMFHRIFSLLSVIFTGYFFYIIYKNKIFSKNIIILASFGIGVIFTQIIWGALVPLSNFSEWSRAGHLSIATIIWTTVVLLTNLMKNPKIISKI